MSEIRLIDANALKEEINSWGCNDYDKHDFIEAVDNAPTVEPEPTDSFYIITQTGQRVEFEMKRPKHEWIEINATNKEAAKYINNFLNGPEYENPSREEVEAMAYAVDVLAKSNTKDYESGILMVPEFFDVTVVGNADGVEVRRD